MDSFLSWCFRSPRFVFFRSGLILIGWREGLRLVLECNELEAQRLVVQLLGGELVVKGGDGGDLFDYAGFAGEGQDDRALEVREGAGLYGFLVIHGGGDVIEGYTAVLGVVGGGGGFEDGFHGEGGIV